MTVRMLSWKAAVYVDSILDHDDEQLCHVKDMPTKFQNTRLMKFSMFTAEDGFWTSVNRE